MDPFVLRDDKTAYNRQTEKDQGTGVKRKHQQIAHGKCKKKSVNGMSNALPIAKTSFSVKPQLINGHQKTMQTENRIRHRFDIALLEKVSQPLRMDLFKSLDKYCERTSIEFWAEPINAISNLSFVFAGLYGLWIWRRTQKRSVLALSAIAILVGAGSFLFHTFANVWSLFADIIPIAIFMLTFFHLTVTRLFGLSKLSASLWTGLFFLACAGGTLLKGPQWMNGSHEYLAAWGALGLVTALSRQTQLLGMLILFSVSLVFRTLDVHICESFPLGTHFIWHILNGVFLALAIRFLSPKPKDLT